jgi:small subunit ribosomal protein S5
MSTPSSPAGDVPASAPAPSADAPSAPRAPRGPRGPGGFNRGPRRDNRDQQQDDSGLFEKVVFINRCSKVVKGGRNFSFAAIAVVGDRAGKIGVGYGKAKEVPDAIKKSTEGAKKHMFAVKLKGDTIPHEVFGAFDGGKVLLKPATTGTGIIAGGAVRAVLEAAGVKNVLTKSMGSSNHVSVVHATVAALLQLKTAEDYARARA